MLMDRREFTRASLGAVSLAALGPSLASPEHLIRKAIPSTGELLPIIGLGTNRYGVDELAASRAPLRAAIKRFHTLGGTLIDTAPRQKQDDEVDNNGSSEADEVVSIPMKFNEPGVA